MADQLAQRLKEWSTNCLIDGLRMDRKEPTLQELLAQAVARLGVETTTSHDSRPLCANCGQPYSKHGKGTLGCTSGPDGVYRPQTRDGWQSMDSAPRDGSAFLAYGIHNTGHVRGLQTHWRVGDSWRAIVVYDVWREVGMGGSEFRFSKDGERLWSEPCGWMPIPEIPAVKTTSPRSIPVPDETLDRRKP